MIDLLRSHPESLVIGGGSNMLFTQDQDRDVIVINTKGKQLIEESESYVDIQIEAGEAWHDLVMWAVSQGYGGIENMALIPGKCGAAPMQNIGAYGREIKDVFVALEAYDKVNDSVFSLNNEECEFGYRDSIFKNALRDKAVILSITLRLTKDGYHLLNTSYGAIEQRLESKRKSLHPTIQDIAEAVIEIRQSKLPDPTQLPNAGSFFKNPILERTQVEELLLTYPDMPNYVVDADYMKLPAGWLIDRAGWRGRRIGDVGTYEHQALVLVNHGSPSGQNIIDFARQIQKSVYDKYGVEIEPEVNIY